MKTAFFPSGEMLALLLLLVIIEFAAFFTISFLKEFGYTITVSVPDLVLRLYRSVSPLQLLLITRFFTRGAVLFVKNFSAFLYTFASICWANDFPEKIKKRQIVKKTLLKENFEDIVSIIVNFFKEINGP